MNTTEIIPTQDELREEQMAKIYGRKISPNSPFRTTQPILPPHTEADEIRLIKIYERGDKYVLLDPATKKPSDEAKDFFYKIVSLITACLGFNEGETRINFQVQKYYRKKTYKIQISPDNANEKEVNEPYFERYPKGDRFGRDGGLKQTGEAIYDADDFLKRFQVERNDT